jgi:ABC-type transporter Mla maintaining outer membrane lipid asymmetry ATPase subunit MlaF
LSVRDPVVEIVGVTKDYRGLRPLRIQQLAVAAADSVALLGFDAASAEVLVNLLTGATLPDAGDVRVFGRSTSSIADSADWLATVDRFGLVTGRAVLLDQLTAIQNLAMPFTLDVEPPPEAVRRRAETLASEVGLPASAWDAAVAELSAADRARLRLGRALATGPAVLLIEHASAGLARADARHLAAQIRRIGDRRGIASIAATADESFAHAVATRVLRLDAATGRLAERRGWFRRRSS